MSILLVYASKHGSTEGIAKRIAETLRREGHATTLHSVFAPERIDVVAHEAVILGSAVYYGSWLREATEFARHNRMALAPSPIWLFSSGPLGAEVKDDEPQPQELAELRETLHPRGHRIFFGALDQTKLSFAERMVVKAMRAPEGDFRNWSDIEAWAQDISSEVSHIALDVPST
jgi:menaquinone-dependent protoporphyrinogen oxidase